MKQGAEPATPIGPEAYTDEYFLTALEGHREFAASRGRQLSPRLVRALKLADPQPGQRVLDIGCGRGEMVAQSALRGAYAVGVDYAGAAMAVARLSLDGSADASPSPVASLGDRRAALARMDATRLAFRAETFDVAFMLDFVEHVHQPELEQALLEVRRALKPGARLIIHTSPNRLFKEIVYPHYMRNVHRLILGVADLLRLHGRFLDSLVPPADRLPFYDEYDQRLHVNPQSPGTLRAALQRHGFRVCRVDVWQPPKGPFFDAELRWHNFGLQVLDVVRFLRPFSHLPPLNRLFSNHIWAVAERPVS